MLPADQTHCVRFLIDLTDQPKYKLGAADVSTHLPFLASRGSSPLDELRRLFV